MPTNPLLQLHNSGQSVWLDNIDRVLLTSGELKRLVDAGEIQGVTSNPTIFQNAIAGCAEYDDAIRTLAESGNDVMAIWEALSTDDIRAAAVILEPLYHSSRGRDGYVSIEVAPSLAHDVEGTVAEAKRLFATVGRPNVMIKVPATQEGVLALVELIADGINVNATLIFSPENYQEIAQGYITGLERLAARGQPLHSVASVASFFVSRVDTAVDRLLETRLQEAAEPNRHARIHALLGQAAIANAKVAYQHFREIFAQERFAVLQQRGARVQRPLWASTSTKNPAYRDVLYVEELIGPDTVNTMPPATVDAFRDHGRVRPSIEEDVDHARQVFVQLAQLGIDMQQVYAELQAAGIRSFTASFDSLLACIRERQVELRAT